MNDAKGLGVKARVKAAIEISFGLGIAALLLLAVNTLTGVREVIMNNVNVAMTCVWFGAVFLQVPGWLGSNPNERYDVGEARVSQE